jgi:hypothetical protein
MNYVICRKINGTEDHYADQSKSSSKRQISRFYSYAESRPKNINNVTWL